MKKAKKIDIDKVVKFYGNDVRAGTLLIAEGFNYEHKYVLGLIRKYQEDFKELSTLKSESFKTKGQTGTEFFLTEKQAAFLGTLFRNSKQAVQFKKLLVKKFFIMKDALAKLKAQRYNSDYIQARQEGKLIRHDETDVLKVLIEYATKAGCSEGFIKNCYTNYTVMVNKALFIIPKGYEKIRESLEAFQLRRVAVAEDIVGRLVLEEIAMRSNYKEIYYICKNKIVDLGEVVGRTEVPQFRIENNQSKQLALF